MQKTSAQQKIWEKESQQRVNIKQSSAIIHLGQTKKKITANHICQKEKQIQRKKNTYEKVNKIFNNDFCGFNQSRRINSISQNISSMSQNLSQRLLKQAIIIKYNCYLFKTQQVCFTRQSKLCFKQNSCDRLLTYPLKCLFLEKYKSQSLQKPYIDYCKYPLMQPFNITLPYYTHFILVQNYLYYFYYLQPFIPISYWCKNYLYYFYYLQPFIPISYWCKNYLYYFYANTLYQDTNVVQTYEKEIITQYIQQKITSLNLSNYKQDPIIQRMNIINISQFTCDILYTCVLQQILCIQTYIVSIIVLLYNILLIQSYLRMQKLLHTFMFQDRILYIISIMHILQIFVIRKVPNPTIHKHGKIVGCLQSPRKYFCFLQTWQIWYI
eukprot:TRINITY_DN3603_c0_g1_i1.p1 TRINITY_DN3603_c0_g1~~TRINITY_DN3603_c0_g1_i1.p1  ORF type:complete len:382 (+),score=-46.78 TRINITY_DN3603_c0_g1_i1:636-1781(+)